MATVSVVDKALRTRYYWPTMHKDARELIRACQDYQGIDIAGPFLEGPGKVKFLIVAIDYFTKRIEAKPVATITGNQVNLDLLEEKREQAVIREEKSKVKMEKYYNSKVRSMSFVGIKSLLNAAS
ncbi:reverse transcriptase domain-containing protein, partial [Tanacetum coccineum]